MMFQRKFLPSPFEALSYFSELHPLVVTSECSVSFHDAGAVLMIVMRRLSAAVEFGYPRESCRASSAGLMCEPYKARSPRKSFDRRRNPSVQFCTVLHRVKRAQVPATDYRPLLGSPLLAIVAVVSSSNSLAAPANGVPRLSERANHYPGAGHRLLHSH